MAEIGNHNATSVVIVCKLIVNLPPPVFKINYDMTSHDITKSLSQFNCKKNSLFDGQ